MTRRVLLTGASGFVGRQAIGALLEHGYQVHAVGNTVTDARASWYRADLLDQAARRQLLAAVRPDALLHCAWARHDQAVHAAPANLDWVAASLELARLAAAQGTARMLFVGGKAECDATASLYGTAKCALHDLLTRFAAGSGVSLIWARLFDLYGPHQHDTGVVPRVLAALREGRRPEIGPARDVRDFMHVADAGRALAQLLASDVRGLVDVASGRPLTLGTLSAMAAQIAGRADLHLGDAAESGPASPLPDTSRLHASGFLPSVSLEDGLAALWRAAGGHVHALPPPDYDAAASLYRAGQLDQARATAEAVLQRTPDHAPALNLLGVLHRRRGDLLNARACLERATALDPQTETAWINLGNVHLDLEAPEAAVEAYSRGLDAAPARSDTRRLLGNALARCGRDAEAMDRFASAVAAMPDSAEVLRDRARAHFIARRYGPALADLDGALEIQPHDPETLLVKSYVLRVSGQPAEATALLEQLLQQAPGNADVHLAIADALLAEERREQANEHYRKAVALRPDDEHALGKLCWSLLNSRYGNEAAHLAEAATIARAMVQRGVLHPGNAHSVQSVLLRVGDLETLAAFDALFPDRRVLLDYWVRRNVVGALHAQLGRVRSFEDRLTLVDCHRAWGARYEAPVTPLHVQGRGVKSRIRVGIMSSDLRNHPVSYFALPIFEHYDRDRFELFAYSFHPGQADDVQRDIAGRITAFRNMPNLPEEEIADRIADDRLDILFELGGSTHLNRLEVMAYQPAPVQVSWLGYPHSSGLSRIGYILVDPYLRPPDSRLLLEQPFEMPASWVSLGRLGFRDDPIVDGLPEERAGRFTFGTMNNPYKYSPDCIALWARVLHAVPDSRFLFVRPEAGVALFRDNMARAFAAHGISPGRLAFAAIRGQHMAQYNAIDVALDTLPQTGGTTTCECLWMGVPTISLIGPAFFERLSFSNLVNAGLGQFAVDQPDAYVEAAAALAGDAGQRRMLRRGLRSQLRESPLGLTRDWVEALQQRIQQIV